MSDTEIIKRLDAIVARLDEQDAAIDALMGKVDRSAVAAAAATQASEQALSSLVGLSRRVAVLERNNETP